MIQSAMLFALGFCVSGLAWLAFSVLLVRRARRLAEQRVLANLSTRRAEFEAERDELRARHAVQMHRVEREVSRILDMATAHRLEADIKERDLVNLRAELAARGEDVEEVRTSLVEDYEQQLSNPYLAAERGYVDAVISPHETRIEVVRALRLLKSKRETLPPKKHGNIPL